MPMVRVSNGGSTQKFTMFLQGNRSCDSVITITKKFPKTVKMLSSTGGTMYMNVNGTTTVLSVGITYTIAQPTTSFSLHYSRPIESFGNITAEMEVSY